MRSVALAGGRGEGGVRVSPCPAAMHIRCFIRPRRPHAAPASPSSPRAPGAARARCAGGGGPAGGAGSQECLQLPLPPASPQLSKCTWGNPLTPPRARVSSAGRDTAPQDHGSTATHQQARPGTPLAAPSTSPLAWAFPACVPGREVCLLGLSGAKFVYRSLGFDFETSFLKIEILSGGAKLMWKFPFINTLLPCKLQLAAFL